MIQIDGVVILPKEEESFLSENRLKCLFEHFFLEKLPALQKNEKSCSIFCFNTSTFKTFIHLRSKLNSKTCKKNRGKPTQE